MELYEEILLKKLDTLGIDPQQLVLLESYQALREIRAIIRDERLDDSVCIEKIVLVLERIGSHGGCRHEAQVDVNNSSPSSSGIEHP